MGTGCAELAAIPTGGDSSLRGRLGPCHLCSGSALRFCHLTKCDEALRKYAEPSLDVKALRVVFLIANASSDFSGENRSS